MINNFETYAVANIGLRPHNLPPDEVWAMVEAVPAEQLTLLSFKPGYYPVHPRSGLPLQRYMEGMITSAELDVLATSEAVLSGEEVCELYRDVLPPDEEDDRRFGIEWKAQLIRYMTSGPLFTYLIQGENAFAKTHRIKNYVRRLHIVDDISKVVENIGHVPDPEDFGISLQILMLGGLAASRSFAEL